MYDVLKEARARGEELLFWGNDQPKCPHCGADYDVEGQDAWHLYQEDEHKITCSGCDQEFWVRTIVQYTFSTDEQEP